MTVEFKEARYLQPVFAIGPTGLNVSELDTVRAGGYDFHDFETNPRDRDRVLVSMIADYPITDEESQNKEVKFLKENVPGLVKINIVAKRRTSNV